MESGWRLGDWAGDLALGAKRVFVVWVNPRLSIVKLEQEARSRARQVLCITHTYICVCIYMCVFIYIYTHTLGKLIKRLFFYLKTTVCALNKLISLPGLWISSEVIMS